MTRPRSLVLAAFAGILLAACSSLPADRGTTADILIRNGRIIDVTGTSGFLAEISQVVS